MRKRFFERGVEAINVLTGKNDAFYYCPICTRPFSKTALERKELTLEHIPPEAQGGKGIALTCSRCNHTAGITVDAAVFDRNKVLEIEPLVTQTGEYKGRVRLNLGEKGLEAINCDLSVKDSFVRIYLLKDRNHPDSSERIKDFFQRLNQTPDHERPNININTRKRYHPWHSKVGDLRTAYLLCFASLGYRYVFDKRLVPVRNQLMRYSEKIINGFWLQSDHTDEPDTNIYIIDKPFSALSVRLGKVFVLLPWFDSPEDFYSYLLLEYPNGGRMNFTASRLPWPNTLETKFDFIKRRDEINTQSTQQLYATDGEKHGGTDTAS